MADRLAGPTLQTTYPCCRTPAAFATVDLVPRECYDRRCGRCRQQWTVTRTTAVDDVMRGLRIDKLEWEPAWRR